MNISVFTNYILKFECKYSYLNECGEFVDDRTDNERIVNGGELMYKISQLLVEVETIAVHSIENGLYFECSNPITGETANYWLTWKAIEGDDK